MVQAAQVAPNLSVNNFQLEVVHHSSKQPLTKHRTV